MAFLYTNVKRVTYGDISIIPDKYKNDALQQKAFVIQHHHRDLCPPLAVDIGHSIQYYISKKEAEARANKIIKEAETLVEGALDAVDAVALYAGHEQVVEEADKLSEELNARLDAAEADNTVRVQWRDLADRIRSILVDFVDCQYFNPQRDKHVQLFLKRHQKAFKHAAFLELSRQIVKTFKHDATLEGT